MHQTRPFDWNCEPSRQRKVWCPGTELNRRHEDFQSSALPTELPGPEGGREKRARKIPCASGGVNAAPSAVHSEGAGIRAGASLPHFRHLSQICLTAVPSLALPREAWTRSVAPYWPPDWYW